MITLAIDSTAKLASVAVLEDDRPLAYYTVDNGLTQSELLLPMVEDMLKNLKLTVAEVDLFAVSVGPGSFTGVRIGAALVKGLAFGRERGVVEVSTLDELAENLRGTNGLIVPVMDARRGQVYTASFRGTSDQLVRLCEDRAISIKELAEDIRNEKAIYLVGDGYGTVKAALDSMGIKTMHTPLLLRGESAVSVGMVAVRKYAQGLTVSDKELKPTYLRMPQAERERLERMNNK